MEEEKFLVLLDRGIKILNDEISKIDKVLPGDVAFKLYDTYGFPLDLTEDILRNKSMSIDTEKFQSLMKESRELAKIKKEVGFVRLATGEACGGRIMFKQFLESGAMNVCQIDSCRLGSINEILTVLLMAHKFDVPVFPHAGGVGLCEYVQHLCMIDYVLINGKKDNKVVEYQDSLHEHFIYPCTMHNGNYMPPQDLGYSIEMKENSVNKFSYPNGEYWKNN